MNIRDSIKNIKSVFKKKPEENKPIPLTGGSVYSDKIKLEQAENNTFIDFTSTATHYPSSFDKTINYNEWLILNMHCEYFANYFKVVCDDYDLFLTIIKVFKGYFYHGNVGIFIVNNKLIPVYEIKNNFNAYGEFESVEVGYLNELFACDVDKYFKHPKNTFTITKNMKNDYIRLGGGMSAYIKWLPFVKLQKQILNMVNDHRFFIHKNLGIKCKDPSALKQEIDIYYNLEVPFFINIGSTTDTNTNNFVDLNQTESANDKVLNYYESVCKIYYELLGRRKNTDYKKERNITAEVEASQSNFDILLNNERKVKELFLANLSKRINKKVYLEKEEDVVENEVKRMNAKQPTTLSSSKS